MIFLKFFTLSLLIYSVLSCSSNISNAKLAKKFEIKDCSIDFDEVNFCAQNNLNSYNKIIKNNVPNFDKNKYLTTFKYKESIYVVIIDLIDNKGYSFPASVNEILNQKPVEFNLYSNVFCLNGNFNQYQNSYQKVKMCYSYSKGDFHLESRKEIQERLNDDKNKIKFIKLPTSSEVFLECQKNKILKECQNMIENEDHKYNVKEISELSAEIFSITRSEIINSLNLNTFRFLPVLNGSTYIIAEKYVDTDEEAFSKFYLIKVKPTLEITDLGNYYFIDKVGNLTYNQEGIKKVIMLDKPNHVRADDLN